MTGPLSSGAASAGGTLWQALAPCLVENWPPGLSRLAGRQVLLPLSLSEMRALLAAARGVGPGFLSMTGGSTRGLEGRLDALLPAFPGGAFIRLGPVSAKDGWRHRQSDGRAFRGREAIEILTWGSRRAAQMVRLCLHVGHETCVVVRPWHAPPRREYRLFVHDGCLVGACQTGNEPVPEEERRALARIVRAMAEDVVQGGLTTGVADVLIDAGAPVLLIDINPWSARTDPMAFTWAKGGDFDGSVRFADGGLL